MAGLNYQAFATAEVVRMTVREYDQDPRRAVALTKEGKRVIVRDDEGNVKMRMSPRVGYTPQE